MKLPPVLRFAALGLCLLSLPPVLAQTEKPASAAQAPTPARKPQFLIILRLVERLHDDKAWTPADNAAVGAHFQRLKDATAAGQVILAGRTNEPGNRTLGLIVFEANNETEARAFMQGDPCVAQGIMTAELRPYQVALLRKQ